MINYVELTLYTADTEIREQLTAMLSLSGFEGFDETAETHLLAYVPADQFAPSTVEAVCSTLGIDYQYKQLAGQNWNASWESNFQPVEVDDFVYIKAPFHPEKNGFAHTLRIMPKMSFGTGHHATTQLMMRAMKEMDFAGRSVLDFGSGTGVLAILAARLGAENVLAIDNEDWSVENTLENAEANAVTIKALCIDRLDKLVGSFDMVLANINLHVLENNAPHFSLISKPGTQFLFSGLLEQDEPVFTQLLSAAGLQKQQVQRLNGWIMVAAARS